MCKVLIVAFHFPPQAGSSGVLRALKFCRYLPESGCLPVVLTAHPRAFDRIHESQLNEIPPEVAVYRAFALDTQKHLAVRRRYSRWMALPDRWISWTLGAIPQGLHLIRKECIDVILTTFPIATSVLIGHVLHRLTGLPWVVDFRDSMTEEHYPRDPLVRRVCRWIEQKAIEEASLCLFTAPSTIHMYLRRYPRLQPERCVLLPNGYDDNDFRGLASHQGACEGYRERPLRVLHMGLLYPDDRDPRPLLRALARLKQEGKVNPSGLQILLRAPGYEPYYAALLRKLDIHNLVRLLPSLPYREALREGSEADALLLLQGASCNHQIPAKAYEYLRLAKPILALTDQAGDTASLLRETGGATIVDMSDERAIAEALPFFLASVQAGRHFLPDPAKVSRFSRQNQAHELGRLLSGLCALRAEPSASKNPA